MYVCVCWRPPTTRCRLHGVAHTQERRMRKDKEKHTRASPSTKKKDRTQYEGSNKIENAQKMSEAVMTVRKEKRGTSAGEGRRGGFERGEAGGREGGGEKTRGIYV
jgi:hypothetical protein